MTEDIVEFGATAPAPKRAYRRPRPQWLNNRMFPVAGVGALAGAGSVLLPWQKLVFQPEQSFRTGTSDDSYQALLISLGAYGSGYLFTLIATITAVAVLFYGNQAGQGTVRVIAAALSGANLVLLAGMANALNRGSAINAGFTILDPSLRGATSISLDWGFYAALAAVVALGVAALRAQPVTEVDAGSGPTAEGGAPSGDGEGEPDDGVIDLSVSVHPVGKQVAAG